MDTRTVKKKPGLNERYAAMTRGLAWDTTYQSRDAVFPMCAFEGIRIHDWDAFADPFRLTMDAYWKYQGEKEKKLYAVIDAFAQNNGHLGVSDVRYVNALKLLVQAVTPLEYCAHRGFAHLGRQFSGDALRIACQFQSADELRHFQTQTHAASLYNRYFNGLHSANQWFDNAWYLSAPKSYVEDALTAGPFELLTAVSFSFDYLLSNLLFVPFMSGAAHNGDLSTVTFGLSAQGDASRHMTLGLECVRFMLEQDPANLAIVQRWIDKWFWRSFRLMTLVAMMQDYMLPKRVMSWKAAWELYVEQSGSALFADLARYGIRKPAGWAAACDAKDHLSHQAWNAFYSYGAAVAFHTWVPGEGEMAWLSTKYPQIFDKYYRPRLEHYAERAAQGKRFYNQTPPLSCTVCRFPMFFTEPGQPRWIAYRESEHDGETYHTCSDGCRDIFEHEPQKYIQSRLAVHQILEGDNGDIEGSEDARNFAGWGAGQNPKEGQL
jgi:phenol/toluene 2-monooxygenase (NADH) P3/A3